MSKPTNLLNNVFKKISNAKTTNLSKFTELKNIVNSSPKVSTKKSTEKKAKILKSTIGSIKKTKKKKKSTYI